MSRTISNSEDVIDSREIIERIAELEAMRVPFSAGWNMPGYLPEMEPATFATFEEARDFLDEELRDAAVAQEGDADEKTNNGEENAADLRGVADALAAEEGPMFSATVGGFAYWIDAAPDDGLTNGDAEELKVLRAVADEAEDYCEDWTHGAMLVRDSYFTDYARGLLDDCGDLPRDLPSYIAIDWEATARNIRSDYTSFDFDGVTYWIR